METSILASTGRMLWRYLDACKVDADALFTRCGLEPVTDPRVTHPYTPTTCCVRLMLRPVSLP